VSQLILLLAATTILLQLAARGGQLVLFTSKRPQTRQTGEKVIY